MIFGASATSDVMQWRKKGVGTDLTGEREEKREVYVPDVVGADVAKEKMLEAMDYYEKKSEAANSFLLGDDVEGEV